LLFLVTTSNYFDYNVLSILLQPIKDEFHVSDTMLGMLSGIFFALIYAAAGLPLARWADRGNRRTVITVSLALWSVMTAMCGFAHSFWQLALARFGLGAAEPGALPPSQSLIADYFPPQRLATASAILNAGSCAGYLVGVVLGGSIAAVYGWRAAFLFAGAPGLLLAVVVRLMLPEPRCQLGFPTASGLQTESLREALRQLRRKRAFLYALAGTSVYTIFSFGTGVFLPSFMIRALGATLAQVSLTWGVALAVADLGGALAGGWLTDRLSRRDIRWRAWVPVLGCTVATPLYLVAFLAQHLWTFIALDFVAEFIVTLGMSVCFAVVHSVCGNSRRTMAIAIAQLSFVLVGCGLGPLITGVLSDTLSALYGAQSLRYSLVTMVFFLVPAAIAFQHSGRAMPAELED